MPSYKDDDGRWRFRFAFRGKRYSGSTPKAHNTQKAADQFERDLVNKLLARTYTGRMPSVEEFSAQFLDFQKANTKQLTHELHETIVRIHIVPHLGGLPIDAVTTSVMVKLMTTWLASAGRRTVNTRTGVLLRMLALGVEWGIVPVVPKVKLLKIEDEPVRFLSDEEGAVLAEAAGRARGIAGKRWRTMVIVALRTGLRIGELRGLQRADVDLHGGALHVRRTDPGRPDVEANSPKGNKMRTVPLTDEAIAVLRGWLELVPDRSSGAWVFPADDVWRNDLRAARDATRARPVAQTSCAGAMARSSKRAKLEGISWHTLRHTFASQLVMRAVPLRAVQELLGHASIKMTERYAHLAPGFANRQLVASLDFPLAAPAPSTLPPGPEDDDPDPPPPSAPQISGSQGASKALTVPRSRPRKDS